MADEDCHRSNLCTILRLLSPWVKGKEDTGKVSLLFTQVLSNLLSTILWLLLVLPLLRGSFDNFAFSTQITLNLSNNWISTVKVDWQWVDVVLLTYFSIQDAYSRNISFEVSLNNKILKAIIINLVCPYHPGMAYHRQKKIVFFIGFWALLVDNDVPHRNLISMLSYLLDCGQKVSVFVTLHKLMMSISPYKWYLATCHN